MQCNIYLPYENHASLKPSNRLRQELAWDFLTDEESFKGNTLWNISSVFSSFLTKKATGFQYTLAWSKLDHFADVKYFMIKIYSYINGVKLEQYVL